MGADFGAFVHTSHLTTARANSEWTVLNGLRQRHSKWNLFHGRWVLYLGERLGFNGLRVQHHGEWRGIDCLRRRGGPYDGKRLFIHGLGQWHHCRRVDFNGLWHMVSGSWLVFQDWTFRMSEMSHDRLSQA